jgi:hypothetical protein
MARAFSNRPLGLVLTAVLVAASAAPAAAATCRDFVGEAESRTRDAAEQKARENAQLLAQASLGAGITLQQVVNGFCRQDSDWSTGVTIVTPWKCTVTVKFCTIDAKTPQPSIPGFTPPPTFKPKLGG